MNDLRLNEFLDSDMLLGSNDSKIIAGWFEFLYISKVNENVYKIGKTNTLRRRDTELKTSDIIYSWNIPRPLDVETLIKQILKHSLWAEAGGEGATEMYKIPLYPMILVSRLAILCIFVSRNYIIDIPPEIRTRLNPFVLGLRYNQIKFLSNLYPSIAGKEQAPYEAGTYVKVRWEDGKIYYAIIVEYNSTTPGGSPGYVVNWEGNYENNTTVPADWVTSVGNRILDIEKTCYDLGIPSTYKPQQVKAPEAKPKPVVPREELKSTRAGRKRTALVRYNPDVANAQARDALMRLPIHKLKEKKIVYTEEDDKSALIEMILMNQLQFKF
jgi:hypothetical protein